MGRQSYRSLRKRVKFDNLVGLVREGLSKLKDPRNRSMGYSFVDIAMAGFALFNLKYPSLLCFEDQTATQRKNLLTLFSIDNLCSDSHLRKVLDKVAPDKLREVFVTLYNRLKQLGVVRDYRVLGDYLTCSVDGVHHYSSEKISCDKCLEKNHGDGSTSYSHSMLCAVLVKAGQREVFPLGSEPILKQDGITKNDCEQNAAKRLLSWLYKHYKDEKFIFVEDALYATGPHIRQLQSCQWDFIIRIKPDGNAKLFEHFEARRSQGAVKTFEYKDSDKRVFLRYEWANNLPLNESNGDIRVNMLRCEQQDAKGKKVSFSWVTSLPLRKTNVIKIAQVARSRWKIENETFNTLKNQGYNFEHNYGHGYENLCTVMAYLMLLAFMVDQIWQRCSQLFNDLWQRAKSKRYLWELIRGVFFLQPLSSFQQIYYIIAAEFEIQLE
jgi:hypothetical protein